MCEELQSLKEVKSRTFEQLSEISREIAQHQTELTPELPLGANGDAELSNFEEIHNFGETLTEVRTSVARGRMSSTSGFV